MKLKKKIKIAIDSPAAAGAGTQAKRISKHYNLFYLDTGKIYRFLGYHKIRDSKKFNISSGNLYDKNISIVLKVMSRSTDDSKFIISANNQNIGELNLEKIESDLYGDKGIFSIDTFNVEINDLEKLNVNIVYSGSSKSLAYLDFIIVQYNEKLVYNAEQKSFKNFDALDYNKIQYKIETEKEKSKRSRQKK